MRPRRQYSPNSLPRAICDVGQIARQLGQISMIGSKSILGASWQRSVVGPCCVTVNTAVKRRCGDVLLSCHAKGPNPIFNARLSPERHRHWAGVGIAYPATCVAANG